MKYIAAFLLFTVTVCHGLRLPTTVVNEFTLKDDVECKTVFSCKDCSTSRVCHPDNSGKLVFLKDSRCPQERPWCDVDSGTCTDKEPPSCGANDDFVCLKNNQYFPDDDCHKFHFCDNKYESKLFECNPPTKVFNPVKQTCDDPDVTQCGNFTCSNNAVKKAQHNKFADYYALCNNQEKNSLPLVVNVCPDMYILNVTSQQCAPDCDKYSSINIADVEDCHNYYHCETIVYQPGTQFITPDKRTCPEGLAYDSTQYACVDEGTVEACKKPSES